MNSFLSRYLSGIVMFLFGSLSLLVVLDSRDPVGLLGWLFSVAVILTAGQPSPRAEAE